MQLISMVAEIIEYSVLSIGTLFMLKCLEDLTTLSKFINHYTTVFTLLKWFIMLLISFIFCLAAGGSDFVLRKVLLYPQPVHNSSNRNCSYI